MVTHQFHLPQKGVNLLPSREDTLFLLWEVDRHFGGVVMFEGVVAVAGCF
jgi:hypothetical protein